MGEISQQGAKIGKGIFTQLLALKLYNLTYCKKYE